jgi:hypothetical protein
VKGEPAFSRDRELASPGERAPDHSSHLLPATQPSQRALILREAGSRALEPRKDAAYFTPTPAADHNSVPRA